QPGSSSSSRAPATWCSIHSWVRARPRWRRRSWGGIIWGSNCWTNMYSLHGSDWRMKGIKMGHRTAMLLALMAAGCAQNVKENQAAAPETTTPISSSPMTPSREMLLGNSVKGAPISARIFGEGARTILILGGIHGDEQ